MNKYIPRCLFVMLILTFSKVTFAQNYNSENDWINYFKEKVKDIDKIEGIYTVKIDYLFELYGRSYRTSNSKTIAIINQGNEYKSRTVKGEPFDLNFNSNSYCYLSFSHNNSVSGKQKYFYKEPSFNVEFEIPNYYVYNDRELKNWLFDAINVDFVIGDESKLFKASSSKLFGKAFYTIKKIFPTQNDIEEIRNAVLSGTGFAISPNGYIVTNSHVVSEGKKIIVKGIDNAFDGIEAKLVLNDSKNDLAILKVDRRINNIPFILKPLNSNVGEEIFVLGYPLRSTMGDEIKLTNGIISSKTGFMGDVTSYQISAPVQPGSSGGPLLNLDGELIGIINSKHSGAESASYAIKSMYLYNILESLPDFESITINQLKGKKLHEQVELTRKFVYMIEVTDF